MAESQDKQLDDLIPVDRSKKEICPSCKTPFCVGELGRGTSIEVKCRRCKMMFVIARL